MKIYLGADHKGYTLKEEIKKWLHKWGYDVDDLGAFKIDHQDDYPDVVSLVAKKVASGDDEVRGVVLGHSGQGEAIVANKYPRVRAAVYYGGPEEIITLSRLHNNANVLSLGASFVSQEHAKVALKLWLETPFSRNPRHSRRLNKITEIEKDFEQK